MNKLLRTLGIITIILSMVLSLVPGKALAAQNDGNIQIEVKGAVSERTLSAYKLFTIDKVEGENTYYSWNDSVKAFFAGYNSELTTVVKATDYMKTLNASQLNELAEAYKAYADANSISDDAHVTGAKGAESVTLTVSGSGYYLIFDETNLNTTGKKAKSVAMLNNVVSDKTGENAIKIKVDEIGTPEKEASAHTAEIGQIVEFTVTAPVPTMAGYETYDFDFIDTLSKGLTFYEDSENVTSVVIGNTTLDLNGATATTDVTYTYPSNPVPNADGTTTLTFSLKDLIKMKEANNVGNIGDTITLTYHAKVNEDAVANDVAGHTQNEVVIQYSNDPYNHESHTTTPPDIEHIYTYTVNFTKVNSSNVTLQGAKFVLKSEGKFVNFSNNGDMTLVSEQSSAKEYVSDNDGEFSISGLKAGKTYTLVEIEAPEDPVTHEKYVLPDFEFTFSIEQTLDNGTLETASFTYTPNGEIKFAGDMMTNTQATTTTAFSIDVVNVKEGALPETGGMGTKIFTIVGLTIMISAAGIVVYRNKKNK